MTWHHEAILESCERYQQQLHDLAASDAELYATPWVQELIAYYENPLGEGEGAFSAHTQPPPLDGWQETVNAYALGYGNASKSVRAVVVGFEHGYDATDLEWNRQDQLPPLGLTSLTVEGCALSALWRMGVLGVPAQQMLGEVQRVAAVAWPAEGRPHYPIFRNPTYHFLLWQPLYSGHTWRKAAKVLGATGGGALTDVEQVFNDEMYMLEMSHIPARVAAQGNGGPCPERLAFLCRILRAYGISNPKGRVWFHGRMGDVAFASAREQIICAFLGVEELPPVNRVPLPTGAGFQPCDRFERGEKRAVVTPHLSAWNMGAYWTELRALQLL
jgi:hypothetical protein